MNYWEIIADRLKARGWSFGYCTAVSNCGQRLNIVDAQRYEGSRYIFRCDEMLTAFLELERLTGDPKRQATSGAEPASQPRASTVVSEDSVRLLNLNDF